MRAGRALRQQWADEKAARVICACGHPAVAHHELQGRYVLEDGAIAYVPHPDYRVLEFHCDEPGCACIRRPS